MRILFFLFMLLFTMPTTTAFAQSQHVTIDMQQMTCADIPPYPNYVNNRSASNAIAAINNARGQEHLPSLQLPNNFYRFTPSMQQIFLINAERTDRGLNPLKLGGTLTHMAQNYAQQMVDQHFFGHTSPTNGTFAQRINSNPSIRDHYTMAAENLAGNPIAGVGPIYEYMYHDASSGCGHRANILTPQMTHIGIGVVVRAISASISVQEFIASASWNPYRCASQEY